MRVIADVSKNGGVFITSFNVYQSTRRNVPEDPNNQGIPCLYQPRVIYICVHVIMPVPVAAGSKVWVCGRSPPEILGSNPTGGMDICLL